MLKKANKLMSLLLVLATVLAIVPLQAFAEEGKVEAFAYDGDAVTFIKEDGTAFGMFAPQEGTTCALDGDNVVIHYVPKNTTIYNGLHFGGINEDLTRDEAFNEDGTFDLTLPKSNCGKALPVAPLQPDGTTTGSQYYLAIPAEDKLAPADPAPGDPEPGEPEPSEPEVPAVEPFPYDGDEVNFIKEDGSGFGMFTPQEGTTCKIDGDNVVIHYVPKNTTTYNAIHWGSIEDELTKDVTFNEDGTFDITLPKEKCGWALPAAPIKAKDGGTSGSQYYLAIPAEDKIKPETPDEPGEPDDPVDPVEPAGDRIDLTVTNNTAMFKVVTAYVETVDGKKNLVIALNGTSYEYLFRGTYDDAVANGDKRENWLKYRENADGKFEFVFELGDDDSYIPMVSISKSYVEKYENGENSLARAFYPRQMELDLEAKTLVVGDYENSQELTVTNNVKMFKVSSASLDTVGGPNSNNYKSDLVLTMGSTSFDKAFVGGVDDLDESKAVELGEGNTFSLPVKWVEEFGKPETLKSLLGESFVMSFHSAKKDMWYEREFTVSEKDGTLTIDEVEFTYTFEAGGDSEWTKGSGEDLAFTVKRSRADANTFKLFDSVEVDGETVDPANYEAVAGSVKVTLKADYLEALAEGEHKVTVKMTDGEAETTLKILAAETPDVPDTGDGMMQWAVTALVSAAAVLTIIRRRREIGA